MKLAFAQMCSVNSIEKNLQSIFDLLATLETLSSSEKPKIVFFPENSLFFRIDEGEPLKSVHIKSESVLKLDQWVKNNNIDLMLTTAIEKSGKIFNSTLFLSTKSHPKVVYDKVHLFDIQLENQRPIRESDVFTHGSGPVIFEYDELKIGLSICYDIRFSELYNYYGKNHVDLILIPAAFLVKTGLAHWEVLLRARAIENQCYIVAPAQSGIHHSLTSEQTRETFGHAMLIDSWGQIQLDAKDQLGLFLFDLKKEDIHKIRTQIPMKNHRRL